MKIYIKTASESKSALRLRAADTVASKFQDEVAGMVDQAVQYFPQLDTNALVNTILDLVRNAWFNEFRRSGFNDYDSMIQYASEYSDSYKVDGIAVYEDKMILQVTSHFGDYYTGRYYVVYKNGSVTCEKCSSSDFSRRDLICELEPF